MQQRPITIEFIIELIYIEIDNHNEVNPDDLQLKKSLETVFLGEGGSLDSLGLLTILVSIENSVKNNIDNNLLIIDELLFNDKDGPYNNVKSLSKYIFKKVK
tara:strand:- start:444 stop:749 length:306 start_codon:yes stop_codon:yes gene_type:complete